MATPGSMRKEATPGGVSRFALTSLSPSHEARRNLAGRFDEDEDEDDEANVSWSSVETAEVRAGPSNALAPVPAPPLHANNV